ncbi:MAG: ATP-dependent DNA ligase [Chitinophagaceae bacterium]
MKRFSTLYERFDQTTKTNEKVAAMRDYLVEAPAEDAVWAVAILSGRRPKRAVNTGLLWKWLYELTELPAWLLEESYHVAGDLAETMSLLLPPAADHSEKPLHTIITELQALHQAAEEEKKAYVTGMWNSLSGSSLFLFNKLLTGGFRVGVSEKIIIKSLAQVYELDESTVAHRISGQWNPAATDLDTLMSEEHHGTDLSKPYPFYLAYPLEQDFSELGAVSDWIIERKYDGIRGQIIVREDNLFIWSRGEDLLTDKFPEFHELSKLLPSGTVIDGEILPVKENMILPFHVMQTRIGRKQLTKKALSDAPLQMICYDLLEENGNDIRPLPLQERRMRLSALLDQLHESAPGMPMQLSPDLGCGDWDTVAAERERARETSSEGLMLKKRDSAYGTGRRKGSWWKWKVDPLTIDGVMIYAQKGHGRRANLYTDFTFAVWDQGDLVPFCKAYSGLTDKEMSEVDAWIKKHTLNKFGPVRAVEPELVFEIAFEGIQPSPRHKSGIALRFPRIARWRLDKSAAAANTKEDLLAILQQHEQS